MGLYLSSDGHCYMFGDSCVFSDLSFSFFRTYSRKHPTARIVWAGTTVQRPPQGASAAPRRGCTGWLLWEPYRPEMYGSGPEILKKTYIPRRYPRPEIYGSGPEILKKTYTPRRYPRPENPKKNIQFNVVCCCLLVGCRQHTQRPPAGANNCPTSEIHIEYLVDLEKSER